MRIMDIHKFPFGTVLSLSENVPSGIVGNYLTTDNKTLYRVKGTPSNIWTEVLLEGETDLQVGQDVHILKLA